LIFPFKLNLFFVSNFFITGFAFFLVIALTKTADAGIPADSLSAETFTQHVEEQHNHKPEYWQNKPSLISLSVNNASLEEIAAALTKMSGKNVVADTKVHEPVTLQLENVSLNTALETLAAVQGLTYTENDSVILISRDDTLKKLSAGFYTFPLDYARAEDLQKPLSAILNTGKLAADAGSNSLLFNGSPAEARKIKEALQTLDKTTQQVTLEAKILSISQSDEKNLGIQWNWDTLPQYNIEERSNTSSAGNRAANTVDKGHLRLWHRTDAQFRFSATLNALITSGKAKVLATPSLITLPGKEASIFIGSHIPVVTEKHNNGENTYSTEYVDAGIKLKYTPIVSRDGYITSAVHTEVSTPTLISELKNYRINSRTADTNVRMRNGETLVIGGLISEEEQKQLQQIPFLSKIPLLGFLFKNHFRSKSKTEVIMLLTPYLSDAGTSPAIHGENEATLRKAAGRH
jgi:protein transport protein HofQ/type IV pilus assembly protein PilQ